MKQMKEAPEANESTEQNEAERHGRKGKPRLVVTKNVLLVGCGKMDKKARIKEEACRIFKQLEPMECAGDEGEEFGLMSQEDVYWAIERAVRRGTELRV